MTIVLIFLLGCALGVLIGSVITKEINKRSAKSYKWFCRGCEGDDFMLAFTSRDLETLKDLRFEHIKDHHFGIPPSTEEPEPYDYDWSEWGKRIADQVLAGLSMNEFPERKQEGYKLERTRVRDLETGDRFFWEHEEFSITNNLYDLPVKRVTGILDCPNAKIDLHFTEGTMQAAHLLDPFNHVAKLVPL